MNDRDLQRHQAAGYARVCAALGLRENAQAEKVLAGILRLRITQRQDPSDHGPRRETECPETGHSGWVWWIDGTTGEAASVGKAMIAAEQALVQRSRDE